MTDLETLNSRETLQVPEALDVAQCLAVVPGGDLNYVRTEEGQRFAKAGRFSTSLPHTRPSGDMQQSDSLDLYPVYEAVGLAGRHLKDDGHYRLAIEAGKSAGHWMTEIGNPELAVAAASLVDRIRYSRMVDFEDQITKLNELVDRVPHPLWVKLMMRGDNNGEHIRMARLSSFYLGEAKDGDPVPAVILEDLTGRQGVVPEDYFTSGTFVKRIDTSSQPVVEAIN